MKTICVVITARPSYSRVKTVLEALQKRSDVELLIIAAGSALTWRHGEVVKQIRADGFRVHWEFPCVVEGGRNVDAAVATGLLTTQLAGHFENIFPKQRAREGMVVTIADRHETLATAIAASYQNIPLCHIQGGEVSGSIDDKVRNAITQLADVHCVATAQAANNVEEMTLRNYSRVFMTGCPSIDLAKRALELGPLPGHDFVVLQHPDTTQVLREGDGAKQIKPTIEALRQYADRVLWFWPGEDAGADEMSKALRMAGLHPVRNLAPLDFLRTLLGSGVLVGNSSVGIRECSFLGVPVVNIGDRQRGRERGPNVVDVGYDSRLIRDAARHMRQQQFESSHLYGDGNAGERIAEILVNGAAEAAA